MSWGKTPRWGKAPIANRGGGGGGGETYFL